VSIDLDAQIESLRGFLIDLDEHYWMIVESGDDGTRYAFGIVIGQLSQRIGRARRDRSASRRRPTHAHPGDTG
jgi:hypothetical protein